MVDQDSLREFSLVHANRSLFHLQEFLELCGGSFSTLETYELQGVLGPKRKCGYCDKEEGDDVTLKLCSRCAQPYCSRTCQKNDWRAHKPVCNTVHESL